MTGGINGHSVAGTTNASLGDIHDDLTQVNDALTGAGSIGLTAATVTNLQDAFTAANEGIRTDLSTIADDLTSILSELLQKIEAGEEVGLTDDAINTLATAIATLFHYPTDYPDAGTHTKLDEVKTLLAALPTASPLTNTQLRATPVPVSGTVAVSNQVANPTDFPDAAAQVKLEALHTDNGSATTTPPTSGTGIIGWLRGIYDKISALPTTTPQTNALTDTQLRASAVPVSGPVTDTQLRASAVPVSGPLTDTQLRASSVPVYEARAPITVTTASPVSSNTVLLDWTLCTGPSVILSFFLTGATSNGNFQVQFGEDQSTARITTTVTRSLTSATGAVAASTILTTNQTPVSMAVAGSYMRVIAQSSFTGIGTIICNALFTQADPPLAADTEFPAAAALADGAANPTTPLVGSSTLGWNGATWDRTRNNANVTVDTSAARTATGVGTTAVNYNAGGAVIFIPVTAVSGTTPTMTVRVQISYDGTTFVDLDTTNAQTASITATGTYVLSVYPGLTNAANSARNAALPRSWRLAWTIAGTTPSFTFSTIAAYVL